MHVVVGPVSAESARAWLGYADKALAHLRSLDDPGVPEPALDGFEQLLGEWRSLAETGGSFHWSSEQRPERAEYLMNALYQAGEMMEREAAAGRDVLRPAEADEFHLRLVDAVLSALGAQGPPHSTFAAEIRSLWGIPELD